MSWRRSRTDRRDGEPPFPEDLLLDAVVDLLGGPGVVGWQTSGRYGLLTSLAGETYDPPVRLDFDHRQLVRHLAGIGLDDSGLAEHVTDPLRRAFVLFGFDLEATLQTRATSGSVVRLVGGAITVDPARDLAAWSGDLPPGRYEWRAGPPSGPARRGRRDRRS